jgi:5'-3' exonuclease
MSNTCPGTVNNFAIDLNGLFHLCAQKVFRYGSYAQSPRLLSTPTLEHLAKEICLRIGVLHAMIKPTRRLVLCVDGIAGLGKMNQQRQRRFRAGRERGDDCIFDSNALSPGTSVMDYITQYIDAYIKRMISTSLDWQHLTVCFSNEKVPGEGEHKIMSFVRRYSSADETWCIYGLDADLILLGMLLPVKNVYIFRELEYNVFHFLNIHMFQKELSTLLRWDTGKPFCQRTAVHDFVLLSFLVGNDFLPTIPSLAILDGALDIIMQAYRETGQKHGHIIRQRHNEYVFHLPALSTLLSKIAQREKGLLEAKYNANDIFHRDPLVLQHLSRGHDGTYRLDFDAYRQTYYDKKCPGHMSDIASLYIHGMHWVLNYYMKGMTDWTWFYPHLYAPFLGDIVRHLDVYDPQQHAPRRSVPVDPLLQLFMILPHTSRVLLPACFHRFYEDKDLEKYFSMDFEIDVAGKRKDWEGIVLLPSIDVPLFTRAYQSVSLPPEDQKRNIVGKTFSYTYSPHDLKPVHHTLCGVIPKYRTIVKVMTL